MTRQLSRALSLTVKIGMGVLSVNHISFNQGASLLPHEPFHITFQYIGDSLSTTQSAIALSGIDSYGNDHGISKVSFPFVSSELYDLMVISKKKKYYDPLHDYTAPQNFKRDYPAAAHVWGWPDPEGRLFDYVVSYQQVVNHRWMFDGKDLKIRMDGQCKVSGYLESSLEEWGMVTDGRGAVNAQALH
ncbi:uncharacterized protein F5891DRAFT_981518 [Suillus fuscotomentosus]|uniref:Uncharacterized protein n=1 Tax=Suillus fuscotomentosus TaxID=1912939 RepID=A0AAD4E3Z9_9AGAM|nr:uncharacterized protein F5891DRAFT_981518 [Suillus fuscotomentosus]KAG1898861.1 hypothetical protein F5891DRAFT_981518 [Suillus fuscotomentosus]